MGVLHQPTLAGWNLAKQCPQTQDSFPIENRKMCIYIYLYLYPYLYLYLYLYLSIYLYKLYILVQVQTLMSTYLIMFI